MKSQEYSVPEERRRKRVERYWENRKVVDDQMKALMTSEGGRTSQQLIVHMLIAGDGGPWSESERAEEGLLWAAR